MLDVLSKTVRSNYSERTFHYLESNFVYHFLSNLPFLMVSNFLTSSKCRHEHTTVVYFARSVKHRIFSFWPHFIDCLTKLDHIIV